MSGVGSRVMDSGGRAFNRGGGRFQGLSGAGFRRTGLCLFISRDQDVAWEFFCGFRTRWSDAGTPLNERQTPLPVLKTQGPFFLSFATLHFSLLIFLRVATLCHMTSTLKDVILFDNLFVSEGYVRLNRRFDECSDDRPYGDRL